LSGHRRMQVVEGVLRIGRIKGFRRVVRQMLLLVSVDVPSSVIVGKEARFMHRARGVVIHPKTVVGARAHIFHNVTIGRGDPYTEVKESPGLAFEIGEDAWLCAGAVVLGTDSVIRVGRGTILAANAVLSRSTGDWEIWAGVPARKVRDRDDPVALRHRPA
jgi:serine O-acetyltransferase